MSTRLTTIEAAQRVKALTRAMMAAEGDSETSKWISTGYMTEGEYAAYEQASEIERLAYLAGQAAERGVRYADFYKYPTEHKALMDEESAIRESIVETTRLRDGVQAIVPGLGHRRLYEFMGPSRAGELAEALRLDVLKARLDVLQDAIRAKSRAGTKVHKMEEAAHAAYSAARSAAIKAGRDEVLDVNRVVVAAGQRAEQAAEHRVRAKWADLKRDILAVLAQWKGGA